MKVKKIKSKKKAMTLEDFALAIQTDLQATRKETRDGFAAVREEMATKADLWTMGRDVKTLEKNVRYLRDDVKNITDALVSKANLATRSPKNSASLSTQNKLRTSRSASTYLRANWVSNRTIAPPSSRPTGTQIGTAETYLD
jgi:hypothetical protein